MSRGISNPCLSTQQGTTYEKHMWQALPRPDPLLPLMQYCEMCGAVRVLTDHVKERETRWSEVEGKTGSERLIAQSQFALDEWNKKDKP
jgi:hypothetical protein